MAKKLILLFEGRTGSSMFGDMLNQHSAIGFMGEEVAHLLGRGWSAQEQWIRSLYSEPPTIQDPRLSSKESLEVVGFKVKLREIADPAGLRETLLEHGAWVIHMTRRNLVKQVVSSIRAIDLNASSGKYNLHAGEESLVPGAYPIPLHRFETTLQWLDSHVANLERFVANLPLPVLHLRYEDLVADPRATVAEVCAWLGVDYQELRGRSLKITSDDLASVISNYPELAAHYEGTRFASDFDDAHGGATDS